MYWSGRSTLSTLAIIFKCLVVGRTVGAAFKWFVLYIYSYARRLLSMRTSFKSFRIGSIVMLLTSILLTFTVATRT